MGSSWPTGSLHYLLLMGSSRLTAACKKLHASPHMGPLAMGLQLAHLAHNEAYKEVPHKTTM